MLAVTVPALPSASCSCSRTTTFVKPVNCNDQAQILLLHTNIITHRLATESSRILEISLSYASTHAIMHPAFTPLSLAINTQHTLKMYSHRGVGTFAAIECASHAHSSRLSSRLNRRALAPSAFSLSACTKPSVAFWPPEARK